MTPEIRTFPGKRLAGFNARMSFTNNQTGSLWRQLMPRKDFIDGRIGTDLFSLEVYDAGYFNRFDASRDFEKWAAVEIARDVKVPEGLRELNVPAGLYAVFIHRGPASEGAKTYRYVFEEWLPGSGYMLDERPHFALMESAYKHESHDSEEEIWIPVRKK